MAQRTWQSIKKAVQDEHKAINGFKNVQPPSSISFWIIKSTAESNNDSTIITKTLRLYFLGKMKGKLEYTLFYYDFLDKPADFEDIEDINIEDLVEWKPLLSFLQPSNNEADMSSEEKLRRERLRLRAIGITSYDHIIHENQSNFAFTIKGALYVCTDNYQEESPDMLPNKPIEVIKVGEVSNIMDVRFCPFNPKLIAFLCDNDLWIKNISGQLMRLTYTRKHNNSFADNCKSAGSPSYICQEEFDRFIGFWWQPHFETKDEKGSFKYRILYEEVDESCVDILNIVGPSNGQSIDQYRYPRSGTNNSTSDLKILEFIINPNGDIENLLIYECEKPLSEIITGFEYLLNAGWLPNGESIYVETLDRKQKVKKLFLLPIGFFKSCNCEENFLNNVLKTKDPLLNDGFIYLLREETSETYSNTNGLLHFLNKPTAFTNSNSLSFICGSELSGFLHLHYVEVSFSDILKYEEKVYMLKATVIIDKSITQGDWQVDSKEVWVDEINQVVYFIGSKDTPLESHLYGVSYSPEINMDPFRLTASGFSHNIYLNKECSHFVTSFSNLTNTPSSQVFSLNVTKNSNDLPLINQTFLGYLFKQIKFPFDKFPSPEIFSFPSQCGYNFYGLIFKPKPLSYFTLFQNNDNDKSVQELTPGVLNEKYPVVLYIYAGPHVQLVDNSFKAIRYLKLQTLANLGYIVVAIDGRGSANRGHAFEYHIRDKMGTVEMLDQIEALKWLEKQLPFMDMNRVAITGWSYGGYMSLIGLANYPDIFKLAISGAPVTSWNLYDTGYTERYMDLPNNNIEGYKRGSVVELAHNFPNEEGRLLIIHGLQDENVHFYHTSILIDALVKAGKPHMLQIYPNERHAIRNSETNEHLEVLSISFLEKNL